MTELISFNEYGSGPPLLLVHGLMMTGEMFKTVIEPLATRHHLIVPDLRGHGRSRGLPPPYTSAQLAADLSNLLGHLHIDSTAVLGYSHGGAIAQQLALDHPKQCSRLVLACTYAFNMATFIEQLEGRFAPLLLRVLGIKRFVRFVISLGLKPSDREKLAWTAKLIAGQDRDLMLIAWKEAMAFDSRRRLAEIKCPTLIIAAENDEGVPFHHAKMLRDGIPGSQLIIVDGADHALIWERPEEFVRIVEKFLAD
jgi:pimeloyl-ACP methyl ester carboxylesterase